MSGPDRRRFRPRVSVRGMMLVVAVTAAALAVYKTRTYGGRRAFYVARAEVYAAQRREFVARAGEARQRADAHLRRADGPAADAETREKNRKWADDERLRERLFRRVAEFDARQEKRFREAADNPWVAEPLPQERLPVHY